MLNGLRRLRPAGRPRWPGWRGWFSLVEQGQLALHLLRWAVLGALSGVFAGVSSWLFLTVLDRLTGYRLDHPVLVWFLPLAGAAIGAAYHYGGGRTGRGNALLIEEIHEPQRWVPARMAPFVLVGTWATHLFGGSAGREGTALQMSASLTDQLARVFRLGPDARRNLLVASLAGGFGAVFGVPLAGTVFALEVPSIGRARYDALVPALAAATVGDLVVTRLGHHHPTRPQFTASLGGTMLLRVVVAGLAFGLAAAAFSALTQRIRTTLAARVAWMPGRPVVGGLAVVGLAVLFGRDYLGLSLPLIERSLAGDRLSFAVFALKMLFTVVTLGCGFPGGEVTPLFVIGATLGAALASPLGVDVALLAAVGFVAVFAGAANTPLACTIMGVESFGRGVALPCAVGCVVAYILSGHRGIYSTQRIATAKGPRPVTGHPTLADWARRPRR